MKREPGPRNPRIEAASGEYDRRRANGVQQPSIDAVARLFKVNPQALRNYRANWISRKRPIR
jgi:hypothetical protein